MVYHKNEQKIDRKTKTLRIGKKDIAIPR